MIEFIAGGALLMVWIVACLCAIFLLIMYTVLWATLLRNRIITEKSYRAPQIKRCDNIKETTPKRIWYEYNHM